MHMTRYARKIWRPCRRVETVRLVCRGGAAQPCSKSHRDKFFARFAPFHHRQQLCAQSRSTNYELTLLNSTKNTDTKSETRRQISNQTPHLRGKPSFSSLQVWLRRRGPTPADKCPDRRHPTQCLRRQASVRFYSRRTFSREETTWGQFTGTGRVLDDRHSFGLVLRRENAPLPLRRRKRVARQGISLFVSSRDKQKGTTKGSCLTRGGLSHT